MVSNATAIVAYLTLFATVGFLFVLASLVLGWFLRAANPTPQKLDTYECGEPSIGPGTVQFDLRFYVVALLFLIFEVEVAFFFPPATIFGTAVHANRTELAATAASREAVSPQAAKGELAFSPATWRTLALIAMVDLGVFFAVLLAGFAFVWRRGDIDWVRAVHHPTTPGETAALAARMQRSEWGP